MKKMMTALLAILAPMPALALTDAEVERGYNQAIALRMAYQPEAAEQLLEKLARERPRTAQIQFDLAVAQAEQGRCAKAARTFARSRDLADIPSFDKAVEAAMTDLCPRLAPFEASVSFSISHDSNINGGSAFHEIDIFGVPMTLDDEARAKTSYGVHLAGSLAYNLRLSNSFYIVPRVTASWSNYEGSKDDRITIAPDLALRYRGDIVDIRVGPGALFAFQEGELTETGIGLVTSADISLGAISGLRFEASRYEIESKESELQDYRRTVLQAEYVRKLQVRNMTARAGISYGDFDYEDDLQDITTKEVYVGISGDLTQRAGFDLALSHQWIDGSTVHPFFGERREDDVTNLSASVSMGQFESVLGRPYIGISHTISDSTFDTKTYDRTQFIAGLTRRF